MKGCLAAFGVIVLLGILGVGGCIAFGVYKAKQFGEKADAALADLHATNQAFPFTQPADGLLQAERLDSFFVVRDAAASRAQTALDQIKELDSLDEQDIGFFDALKKMYGAASAVATAVPDVVRELAASLRQHQLSSDEYDWMTRTIYSTLVAAADSGDAGAAALLARIDTFEAQDVSGGGGGGKNHFDPRSVVEVEAGEFEPGNLALILQHGDQVACSTAAVVIDAIVLSPEHRSLGTAETHEEDA